MYVGWKLNGINLILVELNFEELALVCKKQ